ncbi:hypothetical protein Ndes2526B_g09126 [Nannochloris sp. 'desiccata']
MIKGNVKTKIDALIWKDAEPGRNVAAAAAEYEISPAGLYNAIDVLKGLGVKAAYGPIAYDDSPFDSTPADPLYMERPDWYDHDPNYTPYYNPDLPAASREDRVANVLSEAAVKQLLISAISTGKVFALPISTKSGHPKFQQLCLVSNMRTAGGGFRIPAKSIAMQEIEACPYAETYLKNRGRQQTIQFSHIWWRLFWSSLFAAFADISAAGGRARLATAGGGNTVPTTGGGRSIPAPAPAGDQSSFDEHAEMVQQEYNKQHPEQRQQQPEISSQMEEEEEKISNASAESMDEDSASEGCTLEESGEYESGTSGFC